MSLGHLKHVTQVYQCVSMKPLLSLTMFSTHHHMERLILEYARNNDMQARIIKYHVIFIFNSLFQSQLRNDHRTGSVHFGTDLSGAQRTDIAEGPHFQSML